MSAKHKPPLFGSPSGFGPSRPLGFVNSPAGVAMSMFKRFVEPGRLALITYGPCTAGGAVAAKKRERTW